MAVHSITRSNEAIKMKLTELGLIETIYYEDTSSLLLKLTILSKPIKFAVSATSGSNPFYVYFGDSWTTGSNLNNQKSLTLASYVNTVALIEAPGVLSFALTNNSNQINTITFAKDNALNDIALGFANVTNTNAEAWSYNMTSAIEIAPPIRVVGDGMIDANNNYFTTDLTLKEITTSKITSTSVTGLKMLIKASNNNAQQETFGNDVVVPIYATSDGTVIINGGLVITGGAI